MKKHFLWLLDNNDIVNIVIILKIFKSTQGLKLKKKKVRNDENTIELLHPIIYATSFLLAINIATVN